jgi:hypothetical protein
MILRKSILAGLLFVVIAAIVLPMVVCCYLTWRLPPDRTGEVAIGFEPVAAARSPASWITVVVVFSLGFYLEYRRLKSH